MPLHSHYVDGNLIFYDTYRHRVVDAIGAGVMAKVYLGPNVQPNTIDPPGDGWVTTVVEVGAGTSEINPEVADGDYIASLVTAANENDGLQTQAPGAVFTCLADRKWSAGFRFKVNDVTQSDLLFGVCITDTTLLGGMTDGAYMESLDGGASVSGVSEKDSTEEQSDALGTLVDDTDQFWEMYWDGSVLHFYIDGVEVASHSTTLPDNEGLRLSLAFLTGEAVAQTLSVKDCRAIAWKAA